MVRIDIDTTKYVVLGNVIDQQGNRAGGKILESVTDQETDAIQIIGEGGIGKSVFATHIIKATQELVACYPKIEPKPGNENMASRFNRNRRLRQEVLFHMFPFDESVAKVRKRKGGRHQIDWDPSEWLDVSTEINHTFGSFLNDVSSHNTHVRTFRWDEPKWFAMIDPVVLGKLDKGRTAAAFYGKNPNVLTLGLISDPDNKKRAVKIRQGVMQAGLSGEAIQRIFEGENVVLELEDFAKVPEMMRKMATPELMELSDHQVEKQIDSLFGYSELPQLPEMVIEQIRLNTRLDQIDQRLMYYRRRFAHMKHVLRYQLGIDPKLGGRAMALFNIHRPNETIHIYQQELEDRVKSERIIL